jgi:kumamolisin
VTALSRTIAYPRSSNPASMTPRQVAHAYHFPLTEATGRGYTAGIIELGGGYTDAQVAAYFTKLGLPQPTYVSVPVAGGRNAPDGPNGADGEVQLDMLVPGAIAPAATYRVYFCPNTDAGFLAALKLAAAECDGVSISWGASENQWDPAVMAQFEDVIAEARRRGVPVFAAAGDTGSQDSSGAGDQTDYPASSPSAIGCGGTRLTLDGAGERSAESTWNDNPTDSATGGGVSKAFPGRQVPDVAGNADPDTGYQVMVDGRSYVIGGTSAVAPLMLALHALLHELSGGAGFDFMNLVVTNPQAFYDVTIGDNGGYRAGPGRDQVTGFGVPDGGLLAAALRSGIPAPVPPTPAPAGEDPTSDAVAQAAPRWLRTVSASATSKTAAAVLGRALRAWLPAHHYPPAS